MQNSFSRTKILIGAEAIQKLTASSIAVFGIGGVGSFAAESLARSGIGKLWLFDADTISISNINRQLVALNSTVGKLKVEVMKERILDINPGCVVSLYACFYSESNAADYDLSDFDYIIDAMDTISSKLTLIERANAAGVRIVSSMGAGNRLDPSHFKVADIFETSICPLARKIRHEMRSRSLKGIKVVYSDEVPSVSVNYSSAEHSYAQTEDSSVQCKAPLGSIAFVPSVAGMLLAGTVIRDIIKA